MYLIQNNTPVQLWLRRMRVWISGHLVSLQHLQGPQGGAAFMTCPLSRLPEIIPTLSALEIQACWLTAHKCVQVG